MELFKAAEAANYEQLRQWIRKSMPLLRRATTATPAPAVTLSAQSPMPPLLARAFQQRPPPTVVLGVAHEGVAHEDVALEGVAHEGRGGAAAHSCRRGAM